MDSVKLKPSITMLAFKTEAQANKWKGFYNNVEFCRFEKGPTFWKSDLQWMISRFHSSKEVIIAPFLTFWDSALRKKFSVEDALEHLPESYIVYEVKISKSTTLPTDAKELGIATNLSEARNLEGRVNSGYDAVVVGDGNKTTSIGMLWQNYNFLSY